MITQPVFDLKLLREFQEADRASEDTAPVRYLAAGVIPERGVHEQ